MTHDSHNPEAIQSQETTSINENMEKIWVDVRQAEEWAEWHVEGAIHLPLGEIQAGNISSLPKDKQLLIYCRSGKRSAQAVEILKEKWYPNIIDMWGMNSLMDVNIVR